MPVFDQIENTSNNEFDYYTASSKCQITLDDLINEKLISIENINRLLGATKFRFKHEYNFKNNLVIFRIFLITNGTQYHSIFVKSLAIYDIISKINTINSEKLVIYSAIRSTNPMSVSKIDLFAAAIKRRFKLIISILFESDYISVLYKLFSQSLLSFEQLSEISYWSLGSLKCNEVIQLIESQDLTINTLSKMTVDQRDLLCHLYVYDIFREGMISLNRILAQNTQKLLHRNNRSYLAHELRYVFNIHLGTISTITMKKHQVNQSIIADYKKRLARKLTKHLLPHSSTNDPNTSVSRIPQNSTQFDTNNKSNMHLNIESVTASVKTEMEREREDVTIIKREINRLTRNGSKWYFFGIGNNLKAKKLESALQQAESTAVDVRCDNTVKTALAYHRLPNFFNCKTRSEKNVMTSFATVPQI